MGDVSSEEIKRIKKEIPLLVGENIRRIREEKGYTQVELANRIQSDRQYMYKIETAKVGISVVKLAIIAKALDVSLKQLVDININKIKSGK